MMQEQASSAEPMGSSKSRAVVLGAGVCGLYAAITLLRAGISVMVLEKENLYGGLCASHERGGNFYDLGVHHLHAFDREIFRDLEAMSGGALKPVQLNARIRFGSGYRKYPLAFSDLLANIPIATLFKALGDLGVQQIRNTLAGKAAVNAEQALIACYGKTLYKLFFRDFTHRYWGFPPSQLDARFVREKMPRLKAVDLLCKCLKLAGLKAERSEVANPLEQETLYYTPMGAGGITRALAKQVETLGGKILTGIKVTGLRRDENQIKKVIFQKDGLSQKISCDLCIATIPLPDLVTLIGPPMPESVRRAAGQLTYKPIAVYGLLVRREKVLDALFVYFRERIFHRVAEPKQSGLTVVPEGHTLLLVETTCERGGGKWRGDEAIRKRIVNDLADEGLLHPTQVAAVHHFRSAHGYPIYKRGFEIPLGIVRKHLEKISNLRSTGRQGGFRFPGMHSAMRMGKEAAEKEMLILEKKTRHAESGTK